MAYVIEKKLTNKLSYLPKEISLPKSKDKDMVILDFYKSSDYDDVYQMVKEAIDDGQTYPQETMDQSLFESYYLSHDVFVVRDPVSKKAIGSFYVKPNFPGRSSHICNAGFVVSSSHRKKGIGELLFKNYLYIARDLGYEASFFNLVYATNTGSINICRKLGFTEIGRVPKAGNMKGFGYTDALQFYYDFTHLGADS